MTDVEPRVRLSIEDGIAIVTLDRPSVRNAMDARMVADLADVMRAVGESDEIRVVLLAAAGPSFCSGIDTRHPFPSDIESLYRDARADRDAVVLCRKPVIAAVSGAAFGAGCELALMCDIILADSTARFALPEISRDTMPGFGGTQRLVRLVGRLLAMEICLTGRIVPAEEAAAIGMVNRVVAPDALLSEAREMARQIARPSPLATMMIKEAINGADESFLKAGLQLERRLSQLSLSARTGIRG